MDTSCDSFIVWHPYCSEYFTTEVIRLNQNGFLMIQKDEIAYRKLCQIVKADEF